MSHFVRLLLATVLLYPGALAAQDTTIAGVRFERREAMVPMRDGVRLFTVILAPRNPAAPLPILLSRTPYGTDGWGGTANIAVGYRELIEDGYVFVFQDIRGQHRSEGVFIMNRPPRDRRDAEGRGRGHRHVGHRRVAAPERPRHQRPRRDARHLVPRLPRERRPASTRTRRSRP